jgi:hypothetical protein
MKRVIVKLALYREAREMIMGSCIEVYMDMNVVSERRETRKSL